MFDDEYISNPVVTHLMNFIQQKKQNKNKIKKEMRRNTKARKKKIRKFYSQTKTNLIKKKIKGTGYGLTF